MPWLSETLQQRMPLTLLFLRVRWRLARDRTQQDHAAKLNAEAFAYFHNASQKKWPQEARPEGRSQPIQCLYIYAAIGSSSCVVSRGRTSASQYSIPAIWCCCRQCG